MWNRYVLEHCILFFNYSYALKTFKKCPFSYFLFAWFLKNDALCVDLHDFCQHHTDCQEAGFWTKGSAPLMSTDAHPIVQKNPNIVFTDLGCLNSAIWTTCIDTIFVNNILSLWRKKEAILKQITEAKYVLWSAFPAFWKEQGISEAWRRNVSSLEISWVTFWRN